jgi:hypothetical protein
VCDYGVTYKGTLWRYGTWERMSEKVITYRIATRTRRILHSSQERDSFELEKGQSEKFVALKDSSWDCEGLHCILL